jgi:hypothetical protein
MSGAGPSDARLARLRRGADALRFSGLIHGVVGQVDDQSTVLQTRGAEIQEQPAATTRDTKIIDQLRHFDRADRVQRLQLDQDLTVADEVGRCR